MLEPLKTFARACGNLHRRSSEPDVFLFATPRGGSTWFMEMIGSQPGFKHCSEPFNVRRPEIAEALGIVDFADLYAGDAHLRFQPYLEKLRRNELRFLNPTPFRKNHRWVTNRMVFKVIHAGMDRIPWFQETFDAKILYVIRHPIPVALSRKVFPLLESFGKTGLREHFTEEQCAFADRIRERGDHLEKGVVAWCLHNAIPLRSLKPEWTVVSYEQAVIEPEKVATKLCNRLSLPAPSKLEAQSRKASAVTNQSTGERKALLKGGNDRRELIRSWRKSVETEIEANLIDILTAFGLDTYMIGEDGPKGELWIQQK